jgi:hypothetical protein
MFPIAADGHWEMGILIVLQLRRKNQMTGPGGERRRGNALTIGRPKWHSNVVGDRPGHPRRHTPQEKDGRTIQPTPSLAAPRQLRCHRNVKRNEYMKIESKHYSVISCRLFEIGGLGFFLFIGYFGLSVLSIWPILFFTIGSVLGGVGAFLHSERRLAGIVGTVVNLFGMVIMILYLIHFWEILEPLSDLGPSWY